MSRNASESKLRYDYNLQYNINHSYRGDIQRQRSVYYVLLYILSIYLRCLLQNVLENFRSLKYKIKMLVISTASEHHIQYFRH